MVHQINHYPISEFEKNYFVKQWEEELAILQEMKEELDTASISEKKFLEQKAHVADLEKNLKSKMLELKVDKQMHMLSANIKNLKSVQNSLKKRIVSIKTPSPAQKELEALKKRIDEEVSQEEFGLKPGFKSFPLPLRSIKLIKGDSK